MPEGALFLRFISLSASVISSRPPVLLVYSMLLLLSFERETYSHHNLLLQYTGLMLHTSHIPPDIPSFPFCVRSLADRHIYKKDTALI